jgi:hypothetical protein
MFKKFSGLNGADLMRPCEEKKKKQGNISGRSPFF